MGDQERIAELEADNERLRAECVRLIGRVSDVEAERAGLRSRLRDVERFRDERLRTLNSIANKLGVIHEDDKILAAFARLVRDRDEARDNFQREMQLRAACLVEFDRLNLRLGQVDATTGAEVANALDERDAQSDLAGELLEDCAALEEQVSELLAANATLESEILAANEDIAELCHMLAHFADDNLVEVEVIVGEESRVGTQQGLSESGITEAE